MMAVMILMTMIEIMIICCNDIGNGDDCGDDDADTHDMGL